MSKLLKFTLLSTLAFIIAVFLSTGFIVRSFKEPSDIYDSNFVISNDYIGERLEGEVPFSAGQCAHLTKTSSRKGFKTKSEIYYYAIPVNGEDPENYYYICVEVNENNADTFKALTANLFLGTQGSYKIEGTLKELDSEIYDYSIDYFKDFFPTKTDEEIKEHVLPLCLEMENYSSAKYALIIDIVLLIVTGILWGLFIKSIKTKNASPSNITLGSELPVQMPIQMNNEYSETIPGAADYNTTEKVDSANNFNTDN